MSLEELYDSLRSKDAERTLVKDSMHEIEGSLLQGYIGRVSITILEVKGNDNCSFETSFNLSIGDNKLYNKLINQESSFLLKEKDDSVSINCIIKDTQDILIQEEVDERAIEAGNSNYSYFVNFDCNQLSDDGTELRCSLVLPKDDIYLNEEVSLNIKCSFDLFVKVLDSKNSELSQMNLKIEEMGVLIKAEANKNKQAESNNTAKSTNVKKEKKSKQKQDNREEEIVAPTSKKMGPSIFSQFSGLLGSVIEGKAIVLFGVACYVIHKFGDSASI